jgi:hypothetical protein
MTAPLPRPFPHEFFEPAGGRFSLYQIRRRDAKAPWAPRDRFVDDSPQEGSGFEPSVPLA